MPDIHVVTHTDLRRDSGQSIRLRRLFKTFSRSHSLVVHGCGRFDAGPAAGHLIQQPLTSLMDAAALRRNPLAPSWLFRTGRLIREFRKVIRQAHFLYTDSPLVGFCALLTRGERAMAIEINGLLSEEWLAAGRIPDRNDLRFRVMQRVERASYRAADTLIVVSRGIKDYIVEQFGVPAGRIHVIPNGIEPRLLRMKPDRGMLRRFVHVGQEPVAMFVGGFRPWHGAGNLIRMLPAALARVPALKLVLVGDGPLRSEVEALAHELGLAGHVLFTGYQPPETIPEMLAAADVCLYYPSYDVPGYGFLGDPIKLREYMAMGKPVVVSRVKNFAEIVEQHRCGRVVDGGPEAFGEAVAELMLDPVRAAALGDNGREAMAGGYDWDAVGEDIIEAIALHQFEPGCY